MAQELIYDCIRITKNDNSQVKAIIKDANNQYIESDIKLVIADIGLSIDGTYDSTTHTWSFTIPPEPKLEGRYMYHFEHMGVYLAMPNPIYFV